ncbi:hypothetical protein BKA61DRAFT_720889 [Leptodontidium sp. MPI-SDFR-AT-0119]|nr:hypothetical protein BKA61DRAFT_720889 [Leptodontidium sp. MPI-SDFR-AT-0119]
MYMIMGLKITKGARIASGVERSRETIAKLMADGTAAGIPAKIGPEVEVGARGKETVEWRDEKSFVFAYQLRKIICKKGKIVDDAEFKKGPFLDLDSSKKGKEDEVHYLVEEEDVVEDGEGIPEVEEGEEIVFMWPNK